MLTHTVSIYILPVVITVENLMGQILDWQKSALLHYNQWGFANLPLLKIWTSTSRQAFFQMAKQPPTSLAKEKIKEQLSDILESDMTTIMQLENYVLGLFSAYLKLN